MVGSARLPTCSALLYLSHHISGFITSFEFFTLLRGIISVNMGRNTLPELWTNSSEKQVLFQDPQRVQQTPSDVSHTPKPHSDGRSRPVSS